MDFNIINSNKGTAFIEHDGKCFLAIATGLKNRAFIGTDTSRLQSIPGLLIDNGEIKKWEIDGITEINNEIYYYGSPLSGSTLAVSGINTDILFELVSALKIIKDRNFPVSQFCLSSVFRTDNGRILFFPPLLMEFLNTHRLLSDNQELISPWNHPNLSGNEARSFTLAALAYKTITGNLPFPGKNEDELYKMIVNKEYSSPLLFNPSIKQEIVEHIDESFSGKGDLNLWVSIITNWKKEGFQDKSLTMEEINRISENEDKKEKSQIKKKKISFFFQKNRIRLAITAISIIIVFAILQAPVSKWLSPPVTTGMPREEVITLYYSSFNNLDTGAISDCITSKAGKTDIKIISTIFVTTRYRESIEGESNIINPENWINEGMKPIENDFMIWGITDLVIREIAENTFEVTYRKWVPAQSENIDDNSPNMPEGYSVKDIIHISLIKKAWRIDSLERDSNRIESKLKYKKQL